MMRFSVHDAVCIEIRGKDEELRKKFSEFQMENRIHPIVVRWNGSYFGVFAKEDAKKVKDWLRENGAEQK